MVDILLLGTGGGMPTPDRNLSSALLNYKGHKILIDCGEGTQVSMKIAKTGFKNIDIICITHWHGDHIIGLPGILSTIGNSGRIEPLIIIGPIGIKRIVEGLMVICEYLPYEVKVIECLNNDLNFMCVDNNLVLTDDGDIVISTLKVDHSSPCIAYRFNIRRKPKFELEKAKSNKVPKSIWNTLQRGNSVEVEGKIYNPNMILGEVRGGIKISFVTDTRPIDELVKFIEKSTLFICEGTYGKDLDLDKAIKNKHMTFREAGILAKKGEVKNLILTHFSTAMVNPEEFLDNAKSIFNNTYIGIDRMIKRLSFEN